MGGAVAPMKRWNYKYVILKLYRK